MIVRRDPASGLVRLAGVVAAVPVLGAFPATAGAQQDPVPICHFTGSQTNPYVLVTVPPEGVVEHRAHPRDIIPAPSGGCPGAPVDPTPTPTPTPVPTATPTPGPEGVAICHATGAAGVRRYVRVVVPAADAERHRGHPQDLVPAPAGGCPIGPRDDRPPPVPPGDGPGPPAAGPGAVAPGEAADRPAPVSQANSLNAMRQLPKTGGEALVLALVGAGFVLAGLGVRLRYG